ncbi:transcriptional regulator with XRE-family HTH domain [Lipingzhangella halophila]|uniref:Transcriptional regulator with XRE-family HTH domain n=1 Tax=Lipingzhangella halophila TaxID=1783352 RepID=A0A7W7RN06_9ACTN|nr:helix-turn-helix transcriptional regulator [Lipingzhangella halophila]MBB4934762.1 transcriptional regulator with XRE-family HTH domain [Lipingzhangella halophila]
MTPETFPQMLKGRRNDRGWSQQRLADALCQDSGRATVTRQEVYRWEAGRRVPKFWLPHIANVLGVTREALERAITESCVPQPPTLAELLPGERPVAELSATHRRRVGQSTAERLSARVHALRLADDVLAGHDLVGPAFRELDSAVTLLRESTQTEEVGTALRVAVGELAQIAGWIASDAGRHDQAERTYRLGLSAAREAGDATLAGQLAGSLAYQWSNTHRESDGVELAEAALTEAGDEAPPRARALFWDRVAWAHTKTGNARSAMRALGEAAEALSRHGGEDEPTWLYWVDAGELQVMEARSFTELRRPLRAVPLLNDVLSRYDATHAREMALYLSWLAVAYADANEPEQAANVARRMLDMSTDLGSDRTAERAQVVRMSLEPFRDVPEVREILSAA